VARAHWRRLLAGAVACQVISIGLLYGQLLGADLGAMAPFARALHNWHLPAYATWFILGMVAASHRATFRALLDRYRRPLLWSAGCLFLAGIAEWEILRRATGRPWISPQDTLLDNLYAFLFLLVVLAFDQVGLRWGPFLNRLSARSYGIYLSHVPILETAARGAYHVAPMLLALPGLFQLSLIAFGLGLPLMAMALVRNRVPGRYYRWAFG
jgi:peptidoglycan/LPS O-acetylase OafA/YrhL